MIMFIWPICSYTLVPMLTDNAARSPLYIQLDNLSTETVQDFFQSDCPTCNSVQDWNLDFSNFIVSATKATNLKPGTTRTWKGLLHPSVASQFRLPGKFKK